MTDWMEWGRMWWNSLLFSSGQVLKQPNSKVVQQSLLHSKSLFFLVSHSRCPHTETWNRFTSSTHCLAQSSLAGSLSPTWLLTRSHVYRSLVFPPTNKYCRKTKNYSLLKKLVELTKVCSNADACKCSCLRNNFGPHVLGSMMSLQPCGLQLQEIPSQCCQPREKYSSLVLTEGDPEHESPIVSFLPHSDPTLSVQRNRTHSH